MLDVKLLREGLDGLKERMAPRGVEIDWAEFVSLDRERRDALANLERLKEKKNRLSGEIGKLKKSGDDATAPMREVEEVSEAIRQAEQPIGEIESRFEHFVLGLPNLPHADVAIGKSADDNREIRRWGEPPKFDFPAKNHWEIGEELDILDFVRGAKLAGARFTLYKGAGARPGRRVINFLLDLHPGARGAAERLSPALVNRAALIGTGQLPKFEDELFRIESPE